MHDALVNQYANGDSNKERNESVNPSLIENYLQTENDEQNEPDKIAAREGTAKENGHRTSQNEVCDQNSKKQGPKVAQKAKPKSGTKNQRPPAAQKASPKVAKPQGPKVAQKDTSPKVAPNNTGPKAAQKSSPKAANPQGPKVAQKDTGPKVAPNNTSPKAAQKSGPKAANPEGPNEATTKHIETIEKLRTELKMRDSELQREKENNQELARRLQESESMNEELLKIIVAKNSSNQENPTKYGTNPEITTMKIETKPRLVRYVVGKNGVVIKQLEKDHKARIQISNARDTSTIQIKAPKEEATKAKSAINAILESSKPCAKLCKFFARGNCKFADKCRYLHHTENVMRTSTLTTERRASTTQHTPQKPQWRREEHEQCKPSHNKYSILE